MKDLAVLITAAGTVYMPGITRCLRDNGERNIRIIGADMNSDKTILQMCDAMYQVPKAKDPEYIEVLLDICSEEKVDILLPVMSAELEVLSLNKKRFKEVGTVVSVSEIGPLSVANNKLSLFNHLSKNRFPCAQYYYVNRMQEFEVAVKKLGYPQKKVCIKMTDGSGSRGFRILDDTVSRFETFIFEKPTSAVVSLNEMRDILNEAVEFPQLLLMEYLSGEEYTVDLLADKGRTLYCCCRKSLRMENSIMQESEIICKPEITKLCEDVVTSLGLDGNIGFDIKENENGVPLILECNPRITAGVSFFERSGVNLPYLCIKKLLGENLPQIKQEYGQVVRRRWLEMTT